MFSMKCFSVRRLFLKCQIVLQGIKKSVDLLKEHANISIFTIYVPIAGEGFLSGESSDWKEAWGEGGLACWEYSA